MSSSNASITISDISTLQLLIYIICNDIIMKGGCRALGGWGNMERDRFILSKIFFSTIYDYRTASFRIVEIQKLIGVNNGNMYIEIQN